MQKKHLLTSDEKLKYWGYGEWVEEADTAEFEYEGFECVVHRIFVYEGYEKYLSLGHLCGYVIIPESHPWYEKPYDDITADCHGGLTHSGSFGDGRFKNCDKFCIGFDCAHAWDVTPGLNALMFEMEQEFEEKYPSLKGSPLFKRSYKNMDFCIKELKKIVDQAIIAIKEASV